MTNKKVKFDGKNWLARTLPNGEPQIQFPQGVNKFDFVVGSIRKGLGEKGIIGIINARGENDPNGSDFRYEWLLEQGKGKIQEINNGSAFCITDDLAYVVKGQEVYVRDSEKDPIAAFLFYGLPFGRNINSKDPFEIIHEAKDLGSIVGLSKIVDEKRFKEIYSPEELKDFLSFVILKNGTDHSLNPRRLEKETYKMLKDNVGAVGVTGAYAVARLDKNFTGKFHTRLHLMPPEDPSKFFNYFEKSLRVATPSDIHAPLITRFPLLLEGYMHKKRMKESKDKGEKLTVEYD